MPGSGVALSRGADTFLPLFRRHGRVVAAAWSRPAGDHPAPSHAAIRPYGGDMGDVTDIRGRKRRARLARAEPGAPARRPAVPRRRPGAPAERGRTVSLFWRIF